MPENTLLRYFFSSGSEVDPEDRFHLNRKTRTRRLKEISDILRKHHFLKGFTPEAFRAMLEDLDGNRFLDWIGGVGVLNIGYSHPEVIDAVKAQAEQYFHGMFNIVTHEGYVALAEKLGYHLDRPYQAFLLERPSLS